MTSRKRPLAEISQPQSTPARYVPSTPHALRALQQRSGAKQRSARSVRHIHRPSDVARPDGSARNILKQFAKITAPLTKKRISTPIHANLEDKENQDPDGDENEEDSVLLKRPSFAVEENIEEEEDSELPVAPTPSVLPDDEDPEEPTITFQNIAHLREGRPASEGLDRRRSRVSFFDQHEQEQSNNSDDDEGADATIMTERGRRAISEEATGRFSRYSFGSIRMSDFGTELEVRRNSDQKKMALDINDTSFVSYGKHDAVNLDGETENLRVGLQSPQNVLNDEDSVQISGLGDETFNLQLPDDEQEELTQQYVHVAALGRNSEMLETAHATSEPDTIPERHVSAEDDAAELLLQPTSRRQTLLEGATATAQTSHRKRLKLTRYGTVVPSLPASLVKWVASETQDKGGKRKRTLSRDHMKALEQATEWFFEQMGEDLAAYSNHGRRKRRVDTEDVLLLMRRQKMVSKSGDLLRLAKEWLPKEVVTDLDLPDQP